MSKFVRKLWVFLVIGAMTWPAWSSDVSNAIPIWPGKAPGDAGDLGSEHDGTEPKHEKIAGRVIVRLADVSIPTITLFRPEKSKANGAAVVICPGGAYRMLAYDLEGTEVAEWLNSIGVTAVLLKYRVPNRPGLEKHTAALQDAQRALGIVRQRASEWEIDPKKIGILGFSAGGHLSVMASTAYQKRTYDKVDAADDISCRPDFSILVYPAYLTPDKDRTKLSPEIQVTSETPPTFIVMTQDDPVAVENALVYSMALQQKKVKFGLHVYPFGKHGYGLRPNGKPVTTWPQRAEEWMKEVGIIR